MISASELHKHFKYNPETGELIWKPRAGIDRHEKTFNTRCAGKNAAHEMKKINPNSRTTYFRTILYNKQYLTHRLVWAMHYGEWPKKPLVIDHIDGNGLNNKILNLRVTTNTGNSRNCRLSKNNTSGVNGVWYHKQCKKWVAELMYNRKKISLGLFSNINDAKIATESARVALGFHDLHGTEK